MAFDKDAIIASLKEASISDLNDLVKAIEEEFDVSAAAPVAVAGAAGGEAAAKDSFTVELTSAGSAKVKVIKAVKDITGLGLKDAKDLVDNAPSAVKEDVKEDEANDIKESIETAFSGVQENGKCRISELAEYLAVTEKTVRSRLKEHGDFWIDGGECGLKK